MRSIVRARSRCLFAGLVMALLLSAIPAGLVAQSPTTASLPARMSDQDFWKLVSELSESNGSFRTDNLLSNEARLQYVIPELITRTKPGGAYVGVGPEQNFTLIGATKPAMAFIIDIRRGNRDLQL